MIRIGDFSRLTRVTVKALRHYDTLGLFKPVFVDEESGYRYYAAAQLPDLHRVLALKDAGFSLDEIKILQEAPRISPEAVRKLLITKRAEIQQHVLEEQDRLDRITARLTQWEREEKMPDQEVIIKRVDPMLVAGVRGVIPSMAAVPTALPAMFDELYEHVNRYEHQYTGPWLDVWYDTEFKETDLDIEACAPLVKAVPESGRVKMHELPAVESMACLIHRGPFTGLSESFGVLIRWIDANGYRIDGPSREVYLEYSRAADPETYVTEIQFPVTKA
jgi:effector-binding domain-containing protein